MFVTFFWCLSLRTGVLVIGIIGVVFSTFGIATLGISGIYQKLAEEDPDFEPLRNVIIIATTLLCLNIVTAGILLVGAAKRNHRLFLPWMANTGFITVCLLIGIFTTFTLQAHLATRIFMAVSSIYKFLVVYSYYKELKQQQLTTNILYAEQVDDPVKTIRV